MKALVTGAGSGIGEAIADALHARGDDLVLLARNEQRAEDLRERYAAADVRVADLEEYATVAAAVSRLDRLDAVVHAAGVLELGPVADLRLEDLTGQLRVNLVAPTELTRALLPALRAVARHGRLPQLRRRPGRPPRVVGVRRLQVRPARGRRLPASGGDGSRRAGDERLPRPDRDADAAEGARAGGQGLRRRRLGIAGVGGRHHPARARPAGRRHDPGRHRAAPAPLTCQ